MFLSSGRMEADEVYYKMVFKKQSSAYTICYDFHLILIKIQAQNTNHHFTVDSNSSYLTHIPPQNHIYG